MPKLASVESKVGARMVRGRQQCSEAGNEVGRGSVVQWCDCVEYNFFGPWVSVEKVGLVSG